MHSISNYSNNNYIFNKMRNLILVVITLTIASNVTFADPGYGANKRHRKAKMHRFMSRVFNTNGCKGYKYN